MIETDFICTCEDTSVTHEKHDDADAMLRDVQKRLSQGSASLGAKQCTDANMLTMIVESLNWDFRASITRIANDMWSCVWAETHKKNEDGKPLFATSVQCDVVEQGLARTWQLFADHFPEELEIAK